MLFVVTVKQSGTYWIQKKPGRHSDKVVGGGFYPESWKVKRQEL